MASTEFLSAQNLMTLIAIFVIAAVAFMFFMRKRSNREPMEGRRERNVAADLDAGRKAPDHSPRT
jgi:preprotein translocase subunit YajC